MSDKATAETQEPALEAVTEQVDQALADQAVEGQAKAEKPRNLDLILDIPLKVTVELGRAKMIVNDLLALGQGSVIELNKLAGEPMEVLVNDKLVAKGEAVVVNEKFGVRLTDIISPMERIQQLK
ncbi:MAG: flagellar motor switch protein FliN [Oligoflexia bacterium]|nr:flagellar motor switch protein FliN [Oligoflexia bacterium]